MRIVTVALQYSLQTLFFKTFFSIMIIDNFLYSSVYIYIHVFQSLYLIIISSTQSHNLITNTVPSICCDFFLHGVIEIILMNHINVCVSESSISTVSYLSVSVLSAISNYRYVSF